jgi:hypothetical protein
MTLIGPFRGGIDGAKVVPVHTDNPISIFDTRSLAAPQPNNHVLCDTDCGVPRRS